MSPKKHVLAGKTLKRTYALVVLAQYANQDYASLSLIDPDTVDPDWLVLDTREISITVPGDFDPTPRMVACLQAKKAELTAQFTKAVADLNRQLSELQAIEHVA